MRCIFLSIHLLLCKCFLDPDKAIKDARMTQKFKKYRLVKFSLRGPSAASTSMKSINDSLPSSFASVIFFRIK